ncbi:MAG: ZIP family metal transporter [Candidatus Nanopelagicales bacterium]
MLVAGLWGFVGGVALVVGAVLGLARQFSPRTIGLVMAFGAGVLISALAFELTKEAYDAAGAREVVIGLAAGALTFYLGDRLLDRIGGQHRKRSGGKQKGPGEDATGLVLGALLDGVPESAAIGITLVGGGPVGLAVVVAVFLSNIPEAMSAATGLRKAGYSRRWILALWAGVAVASGVVAMLAYVLLGGADPAVLAVIQAFAAGAILTMLADTMMPEAFENGGRLVGLVTTTGFAAAFLLSQLQ